MPAGVSWGKYVALIVVGIASGLAGSEVVHRYYKPLEDLEDFVQEKVREQKEYTDFDQDEPSLEAEIDRLYDLHRQYKEVQKPQK